MRIVMWGISHHTAGVEVRERVALAAEKLDQALTDLHQTYPRTEVVLLSTCNRTEFYLARPAHDPPTMDDLLSFVASKSGIEVETLRAASIHRENDQALTHLFRVSCGLESLVVGEPQILGQLKRAYELASERQTVGPVLHKVFQQALAVGKDLRNQTGIDRGRLSVGSVAVEFAQEVFDDFADKVVVGIGAGEMAKLTLQHLKALQPAKLWLTNRSPERALLLAQKLELGQRPGGVRPWAELDELLVEADVIITSTASPVPIITAERFKPLTRRRRLRPLFIIDIALPRDVEPGVGHFPNVYLYNIDDLQRVVEKNHRERRDQAARCEPRLIEAARNCLVDIQNRDIGLLIKTLRQHLHDMGQHELERTLNKIKALPPERLTGELPELLNEHTGRLINKIMHMPLAQLHRRDPDASLGFYATALRRLFGLSVSEDAADVPAADKPKPEIKSGKEA